MAEFGMRRPVAPFGREVLGMMRKVYQLERLCPEMSDVSLSPTLYV